MTRNGGVEMPGIVIEKARLNMWNLVMCIVGIAVTAFGWGVMYNEMVAANAVAVSSIQRLNDDVKDIRAQMPAITQLQYQSTRLTDGMADNRVSIKGVDDRVTRVVENFGSKLDEMTKALNNVSTRIEVMSAKLPEKEKDPKQ